MTTTNATNTTNTNDDLTQQIAESLGRKATHVGTPGRSAGLIFPELSHAVVGAAIEVHRHIGPGQLESVYQRALGKELAFRNVPARAQVPIAMRYKGEIVGDFFADFIVDDRIVVELKGRRSTSWRAHRAGPLIPACDRAAARPTDQLQRAGALSRRAPHRAVASRATRSLPR